MPWGANATTYTFQTLDPPHRSIGCLASTAIT